MPIVNVREIYVNVRNCYYALNVWRVLPEGDTRVQMFPFWGKWIYFRLICSVSFMSN